jgi:hypothetical protein
LKKNSNSQTKSVQKTKPTKARGQVQRDSKEVMAELVAKLSERLPVSAACLGNRFRHGSFGEANFTPPLGRP